VLSLLSQPLNPNTIMATIKIPMPALDIIEQVFMFVMLPILYSYKICLYSFFYYCKQG
jgi:hypothetical protein